MISKGIIAGAAVAAATGDPYWANVASLLHFDDADGSTTFTDQTGKVWATAGNAQIDTARPKFGAGSLLLDGHNDWISCTDDDFVLGTGDFTIEMQLYRAGNTNLGSGAAATFFDMRTAVPQLNIAMLLNGSTDSSGSPRSIVLDVNGTVVIQSPNESTGASFDHVALCRASGITRLFTGGIQSGSYTDANNYASNTIRVGARAIIASDYRSLNGSIDEFRITKGVGRYTANFTPPDAPFPNS